MKHTDKQKLARKLSGLQTNHFKSDRWINRKTSIKLRTIRKQFPGRLEALGL